MIEVGSTLLRVHDARLVTLENGLVSFDGNRDGSEGDGSEKSCRVVCLNVVDLGGLHLSL